MPSIESLLSSTPTGFIISCNNLNNLLINDEIILNDLIKDSLYYVKGFINTSTFTKSHSNEFETVNYIYKSYYDSKPLPDKTALATSLDLYTFLNRQTITAIVTILFDSQESSELQVVSSIQGNKLINFNWKVGIALQSNDCKSLTYPYVLITFDIINKNGNKSSHSAELTYSQFQEFRQNLIDVSNALDKY